MSVIPFNELAGSIPSGGAAAAARAASALAYLQDWFARTAARVFRILVRAVMRQRMRRAVRELQRFDDRMLRDIGIERSEIEYAVRFGRELDVAPFAAEWKLWSGCQSPDGAGCGTCNRGR